MTTTPGSINEGVEAIAASAAHSQSGGSTQWSLMLQRRIMRLLLLHDRRLFRGHFRQFYAESTLPTLPLLEQYDRYIRLLAHSDELLDDILPRIRRQLSLRTSQARLQETAPTRGHIDWRRTLERSWNETPGLPPVQFDTRIRQRSTATPENLLTVAILLVFRQTLAQALNDTFHDEALTTQERQLLVSADERAERELAVPYANALLEQARQAPIDTLVAQISAGLRAGSNPYRDLIAWWRSFTSLRIGRFGADAQVALASKRSDAKTDAWLYELWIALEVVHLLHEAQAITPNDTLLDRDLLQFTFTWDTRRFRFSYNRQLEAAQSGEHPGWLHGPSSRPDYLIEREHPLTVAHQQTVIWHEPPVILDAKYYLQGSDPARTHGPIKKLLGDMALLHTAQCVLFFPILPDPPTGEAVTRVVRSRHERHPAGWPADLQLHLVKLSPTMPFETLQQRLSDILDLATQHLPERPPIGCYGAWLDPDTLNASRVRPAGRIVCPKPHIGKEVFDLVHVDTDCLKNPRLCHVIGQPIVPPLVIRPTTWNELEQQLREIRKRSQSARENVSPDDRDTMVEHIHNPIFTSVGRAVEQYVKIRGNTAAIEENFERWVFGDFWKTHARCLAPETRQMLISAEYVCQECTQPPLDDWAAPAIQYCRALEHELKRRLYQKSLGYKGPRWTLGSPLHAYDRSDPNGVHNWSILERLVVQSGAVLADFEQLLQRLQDEKIHSLRNELAHGDPISQQSALKLRMITIGSRQQQGVLVWLAEQLEPLP